MGVRCVMIYVLKYTFLYHLILFINISFNKMPLGAIITSSNLIKNVYAILKIFKMFLFWDFLNIFLINVWSYLCILQ